MSEVADPAASQVVLIGVSEYRRLFTLPAARRNVTDLRDLLQHEDLWGVPPGNCHVLLDPESPAEVSRAIRKAASATGSDGLLLVYFAGHGLVDADDDNLILGLPGCDPEVPYERGVPYDWIRRAVADTRARRRVVILDCCYSGRAGSELGGDGTGTDFIADKAEAEGTCLLVSAPANRPAMAPLGEAYTAFTGELIRLLRDGLRPPPPETIPATLTVHTLWRAVRRAMLRRGFERPELRARDAGGEIALVHNPAAPRHNLAGSVLYAAPWFVDEDLGQRAILVLRHNQTGALGVCITRPDGDIPDEFPEAWRRLLRNPAMLFHGGPVARDGYIVVTLLRSGAPEPLRFTPVRDRLGTMALSASPEDVSGTVDAMRVFVGYLGWRAGELEEFLDRGALIASRHTARQVFTERPGELWQSLQAAR
ncbi:YqgE/AlgH family protein [Actinoplanes friuliensis]|uniref:Oligopeptide-binding lipoprotein n=1 Tax=Actinoplanes friuliensis DSM 7358 TaxID=1246995 RepID=U5WDA9_9ACTN|nr:YqgE/AlgH family protein [Actinoplanes friuliensis]AGZ45936.1 oligopeptide-binding lipoprotein [Actinoplanes friuliensis DSM 7358]